MRSRSGRLSPILLPAVLATAAVLVVARSEDDDPRGPEIEPGSSASAEVVRVVDGDTVLVELGGSEERVRYIGVDTPESAIPGQPAECFGEQASRANARLVDGETVELRFDDELRDRHGRLLAYVYVEDLLVNARLVQRGFARTLAIEPNTDRAQLLDRLASEAGRRGRGLWSAC